MLTNFQTTLIVIFILVIAQVFTLLVNRYWPANLRARLNDVIGWQISVLGTTYAVILGFMLYTSWTQFGVAEYNAAAEANSLIAVYRVAEGLPEPQRAELKDAARLYVDTVLQQDWPAMLAAQKPPFKSREANQKMWQILMSIKNASPAELIAEDHTITELSSLSQDREIRQLQCVWRIPTVLWVVLIIGGTITILSSCIFGTRSLTLHRIHVLAFSLLISLTLAAIADIDRPFQGSVRVSNAAFIRTQINMEVQ
jgi:hypothetical protein